MIPRVFRWIVTTPRRAVTAVAIAALLLVGVPGVQVLKAANHANIAAGRFISESKASHARTATSTLAPPSSPTTVPATTGPVPTEATPGEPAASTAPTGAVTAARTFTNLWLAGRTAKSTDAWVKSLRPVVAPGLVPFLSVTNRQQISQGRAGAPVSDAQGTSTTQRFVVATTSTTKLEVDVDFDGTRWLVTTFGPTT